MKPLINTVIFALLISAKSAFSQSLDNVDKNGLALQGYDPVSYFNEKSPKEGASKYSYRQDGRTYYFVSESNKQAFAKSPEQYEPAYGGWCAYAVGLDGSKVKVDPETYKIVDGKLLLFYNFFFVNTLDKWNEDAAGWGRKAETNWKKMLLED